MALGATASSAKVLPKERKPKLATGSEKSVKDSVASDPTVKAKVRGLFYTHNITWIITGQTQKSSSVGTEQQAVVSSRLQ